MSAIMLQKSTVVVISLTISCAVLIAIVGVCFFIRRREKTRCLTLMMGWAQDENVLNPRDENQNEPMAEVILNDEDVSKII